MRKSTFKQLAVISTISLTAGCAGGRPRADFAVRKFENETFQHFAVSLLSFRYFVKFLVSVSQVVISFNIIGTDLSCGNEILDT